MSIVAGIGIDLTQHVPLVTVALCPEPGTEALASHWPPKVELRGQFRPQPPVALLPIMPGEPLIVGDAAASHRRSAGFAWPPESQVPFAKDPTCGVARIPLVAAWAALLPHDGIDESMTRREDHEFKWCPDGREHAARAGDLLARSIKVFLTAANVPIGTCWTAIVVPDALDEAGQQILLDSLAAIGISPAHLHLLPRPLAVALHWCQSADGRAFGVIAGDEEDGKPAGRLRVLTMGLDVWEAQSLELRARRHNGRIWLVPIRDRARLAGALPELQTLGVSFAVALARAESNSESFGWWSRLFSDDWLNRRLGAGRDMTQVELQILREARSSNPPDGLRREFAQLGSLQPLWARFFQSGPPLLEVIGERWPQQEQRLSTHSLPCRAVLADGAFACLRMEGGLTLANLAGNEIQAAATGHEAAARGAALAATAIGHGLPCYRETLLPLDLYVMGRDEYDDPSPQWKPLIAVQTVEAGLSWRTREPVTGLQISEAQDRLLLPLRRSLRGSPMFRQVGTELAKPATRDQSVRIGVEVKPGQGFARVRIDSVTPGVFSARLDWRTMQECKEPEKPKLAYLPGVSRIIPDPEMFRRAEDAMRSALDALENSSPATVARLRILITFLNKWPLAHYVERTRGHRMDKDFMLHYGVIGSAGKLEALQAPGLARALRSAIGEAFDKQVARGHPRSAVAGALLRAAGWLYLAMPEECYEYLRHRLMEAGDAALSLTAVELHAIGLAFDETEDLRVFYPLLVAALRSGQRPNNWLRALRNICRFRNHALKPDTMPEVLLQQLVQIVLEIMRQQADGGNFRRIFSNCLETLPFLLKRRRYDPDFLAPTSRLSVTLLQFLNRVDSENQTRLPARLQRVPRATVNFLRMEATATDLEQLLGVEDEEESDD
jgi:hypothetical protein